MTASDRRERARQETRQRILDVARDLFAVEGYEAVTMRRIAEKVEYSPAALYLHFADKDELFRALCVNDFAALGAHLVKLEHVADPVVRLRRLFGAYLDFAIERPNQYRLLFMAPRPAGTLPLAEDDPAPALDAYGHLRDTLAEALAAGRLREGLRDPDLLAQALWSGVHGVAALYIALCSEKKLPWRPVRSIGKVLLDIVLEGLVRK